MRGRFEREYSWSFCRYFYHLDDYWALERLIEWTPSFHGIHVIGGKTYRYTNDGQKMGPFRLYQLDIDSVGAYNLIKQYLETIYSSTYL